MTRDPPMHRPSGHEQPHIVRLFAGMVVAPFAWAIQLLIAYALAAHACYPTDVALAAPVVPHLRRLVVGVTAATWILLVVGVAIAWSNWKSTHRQSSSGPHEIIQTGDGRARFMSLCGLLVSGVFAIALLFTTVGAFLVPDCGP